MEETTYSVTTECSNCGNILNQTFPKGVRVRDQKCNNCECDNCLFTIIKPTL